MIQVNEGKPLSFISWKEQGIFPWKICRLLLPPSTTLALLLCALGDINTLLPHPKLMGSQSCPIPFPGSPPGSVVPSSLPHSHALLGAFRVCPHSSPSPSAGPAAPSSTPKETAGKRDSCWTAVMDPTTSLQPASATLLAAFPPVLSQAKWAHLGVSYCNHEFWGPRNYLKLTPFARFVCEAGMS